MHATSSASRIVCSSRRLCLTSLAIVECLCFWALCLPALRHQHPSFCRASESLECFPSLPGPSCRLGLSDPEGPSQLFGTQRHCSFQKNPGTWGLSSLSTHPSLPGAQLWGTSPLPAQGPSLTLTSVPLGQLCGGQEILLGCLGPWL